MASSSENRGESYSSSDKFHADEPCEGSVLYRHKPEWADVTPIEQDDGPMPVVAIAYSERFKDVFDYFRVVVKNEEISERAFRLTKDAVELCAANYTVWQYRRKLLKELNKNLYNELHMISDIIFQEPKNYQVWYHRRVLVEWLQDASDELNFTAEVFEDDPKNFHCWQHRQWCLRMFNLWRDNGVSELSFTSNLIKQDVRNNSVWNHRYYVVSNTVGFNDVLDSEISYTWHWITKAPRNESSWNYLAGILYGRMKAYLHPSLKSDCISLLNQNTRSPHLLAFLVDLYEEEIEDVDKDDCKRELIVIASELCDRLADDIDVIRKKYWKYTKRRINSKFTEEQNPIQEAS